MKRDQPPATWKRSLWPQGTSLAVAAELDDGPARTRPRRRRARPRHASCADRGRREARSRPAPVAKSRVVAELERARSAPPPPRAAGRPEGEHRAARAAGSTTASDAPWRMQEVPRSTVMGEAPNKAVGLLIQDRRRVPWDVPATTATPPMQSGRQQPGFTSRIPRPHGGAEAPSGEEVVRRPRGDDARQNMRPVRARRRTEQGLRRDKRPRSHPPT